MAASVFISWVCAGYAQSQAELKRRVDLLEARVAKLEASIVKQESKEGAAATKEELTEALDKTLGCPMVTQRVGPRRLANSHPKAPDLAARTARRAPTH